MVDLAQFHQLFFDESEEHLAEMERLLLSLPAAGFPEEDLHALFRAAHSIKGGAATFGFPEVAEFTHVAESILDRVRNHETALDTQLFLEARDVIGELISFHRDGRPIDGIRLKEVRGRLVDASAESESEPAPKAEPPRESVSAQPQSLTLLYSPSHDIFRRGVRFDMILDELRDMGEVQVTAEGTLAPILTLCAPELCQTRWRIHFAGSASEEEIRELFAFFAEPEELAFLSELEAAPQAVAVQGYGAGQISAPQYAAGKGAETTTGAAASEGGSFRVGTAKVDELVNQVGELVITHAIVKQRLSLMEGAQYRNLLDDLSAMERTMRGLQQSVLSLRMVPVAQLFGRFPRVVHDLSRKLGKEVELKTVGDATELDKTFIELLTDPLTHLVRNCIDHGIEGPEARLAAGKPAKGTVTLNAAHQGGRIALEVCDDGAGLNRERILEKATLLGLIPEGSELPDEEVWKLIFLPGFSTAAEVSDVSGRGVGMDVVLRNVQKLGGRITVASRQGEGSSFTISLPLTLAIMEGLHVQSGAETVIIPLDVIVESIPLDHGCSRITGESEVVELRGDFIPLVPLGPLLKLRGAEERERIAVVVDVGGERVGIAVDGLLGEHQVVMKSLEQNYGRVPGMAGATILGNGRVAFVVDAAEITELWRSKGGFHDYQQ
ncbi:chemotaxis protein CheA [Geomonas agri]|uniref:chemotaxis protein CheA n=1 Tax=Geomonas agri TaxID=2873702 RepID=UPI001CD24856|nr:chemotaxis protein CheA [Geomonas agri]